MVKKDIRLRDLVIVLIYFILAIAFIYIVVTQFSSLKHSINLIGQSNRVYEFVAGLFVLLTYFSASQTYYFLSFKPLRLIRTIVVEFGVTTINKIIPSGIGNLATNYRYLRKADNNRSQAVSAVAINNLMGLVANLLLLSFLLIFVKTNPLVIGRPNNRDLIIIVIILSLAALILMGSHKLRRKASAESRSIIKELKSYRHRPDHLLFGFITQISLSFANVLALYFSLQAVHANLSLSSVMLALSFATWLGAVIPTPGGIGAVETGLTGALIAFGLRFDVALSGVLIYRLLSTWLPFFIGGLSLVWSRKHRYI